MLWIVVPVSLLAALGQPLAADPPARPVVAWPSGPLEVRVAYDRPLDPAMARAVVGREIPYYEHLAIRATGEITPGRPMLGSLRIAGSRQADDGKTLILATDPHPRQAYYVLAGALEQGRSRDLFSYTLSGVEATWDDGRKDALPEWSGWLPAGPSFDAKMPVLDASAEHAKLKEKLAKPGRLTMKGTLMVPKGKATVCFGGSGAFAATVNGEEARPVEKPGRRKWTEVSVVSDGSPLELASTVTTGPGVEFSIMMQAEEVGRPSTFAADVRVPWSPPAAPQVTTIPPPPFELGGGDRTKGEAVFLSEAAKCSSCHEVGGKGGKIGPNLDAWKGRDLAEVFYHIAEPSARIVPDYLTYTVARKNGQVAVGVVKAEGFDAIRVTDIGAQTTVIPKAEIDDFQPSTASTMPVGLPGALGEANMRDLLAFLTGR